MNFATATICKRCKSEFAQDAGEQSGVFSNSFDAEPNFNRQQHFHNHAQPNYYSPPAVGGGEKSGLAITSLVLGIIGFFTMGLLVIGSLIGLIIGIVALTKANRSPREYGGKGLAVGGIVLNAIGVFNIVFIGIIAAIAIPNLLAARRAANEAGAITTMRVLLRAEDNYRDANNSQKCADLSELNENNFIDSRVASGQKSGYQFQIVKRGNGVCDLNATPLVGKGVSATGNRSFYASTAEGEIHAANKGGQPAGANDVLLESFDTAPRR